MPDDARSVVLRLQAQGDHSEQELLLALERRGFSALEIADALSWGRTHAAVDDARTADSLVARQQGKGRGALRIEAELERRGLDTSRAPAADDREERARAHALLVSKGERFRDAPAKAAAWLARQGFSEDVVRDVVQAVIGRLDEV